MGWEGIPEQVDALYEASDSLAHAIMTRIVELTLEPPAETAL